MARVFSSKSVLRHISADLRTQFFERQNCPTPAFSTSRPTKRELDELVSFLSSLPDDQFHEIEHALKRVHEMACSTGIDALREAGDITSDDELRQILSQDVNGYERAMWVLLHRPHLLHRAGLIHQAENLPWWRKRNDLPREAPNASAEAKCGLQVAITNILQLMQGRGRVCTVEHLARGGTDYFFAHADDHIQCVTAHDAKRRLISRPVRQTFPIVFAFQPHFGSLELHAKLPEEIKTVMERLFAHCMLDHELDEWMPPPAYRLDYLKERGFSLATDPEDGLRVSIQMLRFSVVNSRRQITLKADPSRQDDIYQLLDETVARERVHLAGLKVTQVAFHFEFLATAHRRAGSATFLLTSPRGGNLRNQTQERVDLITKYLRRWGIDDTELAQVDLESFGERSSHALGGRTGAFTAG